MRFPLFERHPREELPGYLDKELVFPRVEAVEAHLSSCPTCRAELDALRALKSQLAALPESPAPRSFALTPAMARRPAQEPERVRRPERVAALSNGMRLAGAGMAVALAVVMVLNFSGSGSDSGDDSAGQALTVPEARTTDTTAQYSNDAATGALAIPSPAPTAAADNPVTTVAPPAEGASGGTAGSVGGVGSADNETTATSVPGTTFAPSTTVGVGGGVGGAVGGVGSADNEPTATSVPGTTLAPSTTAQTVPQTGSDGAFVPDASPTATYLVGKTITDSGSPRVGATEAPAIKNVQTDQPTLEADRTVSTQSDGGVDILLLVAVALAAGVVLAFAGSVLLPRIARDDH